MNIVTFFRERINTARGVIKLLLKAISSAAARSRGVKNKVREIRVCTRHEQTWSGGIIGWESSISLVLIRGFACVEYEKYNNHMYFENFFNWLRSTLTPFKDYKIHIFYLKQKKIYREHTFEIYLHDTKILTRRVLLTYAGYFCFISYLVTQNKSK